DYFKISSMENIYEVGSIETSSFEDFVYYSNEIRKVNREVIESKCGEDNVVSEWREVFKVMNKQNI
ncbi:MAG: hypothetical protein E6540_00670, partial [Enterococcus sp.]|nr:hypothetical protein [Enterococcus sp.]